MTQVIFTVSPTLFKPGLIRVTKKIRKPHKYVLSTKIKDE